MLTISKPLSPAQIRMYHAEEFSNARDNYYTTGDQIHGRWHGQLARAWGLSGAVQDGHIDRAHLKRLVLATSINSLPRPFSTAFIIQRPKP